MNITRYIDYALLDSTTTESDIIQLCQEAIQYNFYGICINSCYVSLANQFLKETDINISAVVGFPLGAASTKSKIFEAQQAIKDGASEIDMVINLGLLKSRNYVSVLKDISDIKFAIENTPLKVTIEIDELNKNEIVKVCEICLDAGADYIKTSTGFTKNGATFTAVKMIKKIVRDKVKIKASGGIDDYESILKYIEAGADRVETATNIMATNKAQQIRNSKIFKQYLENLEKSKTTSDSSIITKV
ncbi:deoxyribose-phosphate aldolase [Sabulilitoribacter multivorans]|uniref:Deoxyribose-phosphate aldolase n=1 Tax=Flaviramulus multivorans TaxID=1304750 RepID=A0ABS9IHC5_9FLAO|nr:deoxyribose-phosphate aldolase [Flaviramulus multivorans]MCF7560157.1 deoxyribose-phosphate aldolase [Flaviramulus multivorans]